MGIKRVKHLFLQLFLVIPRRSSPVGPDALQLLDRRQESNCPVSLAGTARQFVKAASGSARFASETPILCRITGKSQLAESSLRNRHILQPATLPGRAPLRGEFGRPTAPLCSPVRCVDVCAKDAGDRRGCVGRSLSQEPLKIRRPCCKTACRAVVSTCWCL